MKPYRWNEEKNALLKIQRGISFEEVVVAIGDGKILDTLEHWNKIKHPNQRLYIVVIDNYACIIPFIETEEEIFLKTVIPSRKATKRYLIDAKK